jgi:hypothetical protein
MFSYVQFSADTERLISTDSILFVSLVHIAMSRYRSKSSYFVTIHLTCSLTVTMWTIFFHSRWYPVCEPRGEPVLVECQSCVRITFFVWKSHKVDGLATRAWRRVAYVINTYIHSFIHLLIPKIHNWLHSPRIQNKSRIRHKSRNAVTYNNKI